MFISKWMQSLKKASVLISDTRKVLKDVNHLMSSIDPVFIRWTWAGAVWQGMYSLGWFAVTGIILQQVMQKYLKAGSINFAVLSAGVIGFSLFTILTRGCQIIQNWRDRTFSNKVDDLLSKKMIQHMATLDMGRLADPSFLLLKDNAERRGNYAVERLWRQQVYLLAGIIGFIASVSTILVFKPVLIFVVIIPTVPRIIKAVVVDQQRRKLWESQHIARRQKNEYEWCLINRNMSTHLRLLRFTGYVWGRFVFFVDKLRSESLNLEWFNCKADLGLMVMETVLIGFVIAWLGIDLNSGALPVTKLFVLIGCVKTFSFSLYGTSNAFVEIRSKCVDYGYLTDFFKTKPLIDEAGTKDVLITATPRLSLQNVSFSYPEQDSFALKDCSIMIRSGEKVAIVGPNGSGKTTVAKLLTKVYLPSSGEVLVNDSPITELSQKSWLDHILYVMQNCQIPDFEIDVAITGVNRQDINQERFARAVEISGIDQFVKPLVAGYQTQIGEEWPGGVGFSSGQLQRLALAASLYRLFDHRVLIGLFDEPMAHCDSETKERFYRSLGQIEGKTIVVIAHDPLYLQHFDRIIVMEEGHVESDIKGRENIEQYRHQVATTLYVDL